MTFFDERECVFFLATDLMTFRYRLFEVNFFAWFIRDSLVWSLKTNPQTNCSELKVSNRLQQFGVSNSGCFQLKMRRFSGVHVVPS